MSVIVCSPSPSSCYHVQLRRQPKPCNGSLATTSTRNEILWESLRELQSSTSRNPPPVEPQPSSTPSPTTSSSYPYVFEPIVSLPNKFNVTRAYLRGFINQIRLIIHLQFHWYANTFSRASLMQARNFQCSIYHT